METISRRALLTPICDVLHFLLLQSDTLCMSVCVCELRAADFARRQRPTEQHLVVLVRYDQFFFVSTLHQRRRRTWHLHGRSIDLSALATAYANCVCGHAQ